MFWDIFLRLCIDANKSPTAVGTELGFSRATVSNWKNGGAPRETAIHKIADYFGVTVDYLLGKEQEKKPSETEDLEEIRVALFGGDTEVTPEMWEEVKQFARFVAMKKKQEKK